MDVVLLRSAEDLIIEGGFGSLSIGAIALRAGTTRPTFYRRFDGIAHLMLALLQERFGMNLDLEIDSGNLPDDLVLIQREQIELFSSPLGQNGLAGFLDSLHRDADLRQVFLDEFLGPRRQDVAMIIRRAEARGEIPPDPDVEWACDLLTGPLMLRAVMPGLEGLDEPFLAQTVAGALCALGYRTPRKGLVSMSQTVDSSLVHKSSANQVMLLGVELHEDGSMGIDVGLSEAHPSAGMLPSCSTLLGVELMRQCAIAYAHLGAGVPRDWAFLMNEITFSWQDGYVPHTAEEFTGNAEVRLHAVKKRKGQVSDLQLDVEYIRDGLVWGRGSGDFSVLPPRAYQAIRRNAPIATAESTGPLGAVLAEARKGPEALEARLVWNQEDRFIFDHPSDHVSGMLLANALLQAHLVLAGSQAVDFSLSCVSFAEHDAPVHVVARLAGADRSRISITQSGREIATGRGSGPQADVPFLGVFRRQLTPVPSRP